MITILWCIMENNMMVFICRRSNGVIFCWCWRDMLPTYSAFWRTYNLCSSFELSGFASIGKQEKEMNNVSACILYLLKNNNNHLAIYFTSLDKGSTSGRWFVGIVRKKRSNMTGAFINILKRKKYVLCLKLRPKALYAFLYPERTRQGQNRL